jgi:16S rRNA (cytidine1402-2'-O)-methyltransferase
VIYESPVRVLDALSAMAEVWGDREAFLCREATKSHEEYVRGRILEIRERLATRKSVLGEIVLVVAGAPDAAPATDEEPEELYARLAAEGRTRREAVKEVARRCGLPAREVYRRVLEAEHPEGED